jgi:hypothetical protein
VGDKQQAVAEKSSLEQQLKQAQGKNLIIEKSLEKKDQIESKKRESIMVVSQALQWLLDAWTARKWSCAQRDFLLLIHRITLSPSALHPLHIHLSAPEPLQEQGPAEQH